MNKFDKFRAKNPVFTYKSYNINETENSVEISYSFSIDGLAEFTPSWVFPKPALQFRFGFAAAKTFRCW